MCARSGTRSYVGDFLYWAGLESKDLELQPHYLVIVIAGWMVTTKRICPCPNTPTLWMWPYLEKGSLQVSFGEGSWDENILALNSMTVSLEKEGRTQTEEKAILDTGKQILEWCSHKSRNLWSPQELEEAKQDSLIEPSEGVRSCQHLDFILLAFRTLREYISVVLSLQAYGNLLQQAQKTNTVRLLGKSITFSMSIYSSCLVQGWY